jgi:hypothetical protein
MKQSILCFTFVLIGIITGECQTFFETAKDDGVIAFRPTSGKTDPTTTNTISQFKISPTSTAITYGFYGFVGDHADNRLFIYNIEAKVRPNSDGIAALIRSGKLQSGIGLNGAFGVRFNDNIFENRLFILDIYLKPEYSYTRQTIYDSTRFSNGKEALYKADKHYFGINLLLNALFTVGPCNVFLGAQVGHRTSDNVDDLADVTIQSTNQFIGQPYTQVKSSIITAKEGIYKNVNTMPFKFDIMLDTQVKIAETDSSNISLGVFSYFRNDLRYNKHQYRVGFGLCLLNAENPSKVFTSLGYELPMFGKEVDEENSKGDKGIVFVSIGYTIF